MIIGNWIMKYFDLKRTKYSKQKQLILRILRANHSHPNAHWIFEQARKEIPHISLGTVYRNLNSLIQEGKIREIIFGNGLSLYDGDLRNHDHIQCTVCNRVDDIPNFFHPISVDQVSAVTGYQVLHRRLDFFGTCPQCSEKRMIFENY